MTKKRRKFRSEVPESAGKIAAAHPHSLHPPVQHALSTNEISDELRRLSACWEQLQPLDSHARMRVLEWLRMWAGSEDPARGGVF